MLNTKTRLYGGASNWNDIQPSAGMLNKLVSNEIILWAPLNVV